MKSIIATSLATLAVAVASPAFGQSSSSQDGMFSGLRMPYQTGFWGHAGLNVGRSKIDASCPAGFACDQRDTTWRAYVGGKFNNTIGMEVGLMDFGDFTRGGGQTKARGLDVAFLAGIPFGFGQNSSVFVKLGTAYTRTKASGTAPVTSDFQTGSESGWGPRYGIGAQVGINQNWAIRLDADRYRVRLPGPRENIDTFTIGAQYSFK